MLAFPIIDAVKIFQEWQHLERQVASSGNEEVWTQRQRLKFSTNSGKGGFRLMSDFMVALKFLTVTPLGRENVFQLADGQVPVLLFVIGLLLGGLMIGINGAAHLTWDGLGT